MKLRAKIVAQTGEATLVELQADTIRLGRDSDCEFLFDAARYPQVSGLHALIEPRGDGFMLIPKSKSNKTLHNNVPIPVATSLRRGDRIRLGVTGPLIEIISLEEFLADASGADSGQTLQAGEAHWKLLRGTANIDRFPLGRGGVIGRQRGRVQYLLDHPHVSRLHASLAVKNSRVVLADLGSANGTFVNGKRVARPTVLAVGDRLDVGPFALTFEGNELVGASRANNIELIAHGVSRVVTNQETGGPLTLLDDISLVVRPREFVCLLGPSGSGKSTLLAMLSGRATPSAGQVTVNGRDLYAHFAAHKQDIAVVPQKDILHESLRVGRALQYTAELRLPPDTDGVETRQAVEDILEVVGLTQRRETLIRNLSGGQVKRASLANELLSKPSLLLLDEVTSGLDEQTDREVMELFRLVADGGKTVVCITHNLANVEATCSLVVVLTAGGKLAFVGTPDEAKAYFAVTRLGDVYRKLAEQSAEVWKNEFLESELHERYVRGRMPAVTAVESVTRGDDLQSVPSRPLHQAYVLTRRYASVWRGDLTALGALLGQSLLVAVLLAIVFGVLADVSDPVERTLRTRNLLFLLGVSCFWFGCNTAAKELVKERSIFTRERAVNLRTDSYFVSKLIVLLVIGMVQATILFGIVRVFCEPTGNPTGQWLIMTCLTVAGTALGLALSAVTDSEEVAIALVPVAVIPQIILAGVIAPLAGGKVWLAKICISAYWGQLAFERLLPEQERAILSLRSATATTPALILLAHAAVYALAAVIVLRFRSRRGAS